MGFFDDILTAIGRAVNTVMYAAGTVVGIAAAGVVEFAQVAYEKYGEFRAKNRSLNLATANQPIYKATRNLNDEIHELEQKKNRDRGLNQNDIANLGNLYAQRGALKEEVRRNNELAMVEKMQNGNGVYDSIHIDNDKTHILQFHVGQTVFGKQCRECGRPMTLQWRRGTQSILMSEFFWGCIGFYEGIKHSEPFKQSDMDLFTKVDRPEFALTSKALGNIIMLPGSVSSITSRMNKIKNVSTDVYLCPIHNEPMIVREKKDAQGLLDQYFFGCPRWLPNGQGCGQMVTIKSPAQLASALEAFYGRGIL